MLKLTIWSDVSGPVLKYDIQPTEGLSSESWLATRQGFKKGS